MKTLVKSALITTLGFMVYGTAEANSLTSISEGKFENTSIILTPDSSTINKDELRNMLSERLSKEYNIQDYAGEGKVRILFKADNSNHLTLVRTISTEKSLESVVKSAFPKNKKKIQTEINEEGTIYMVDVKFKRPNQ